MHTAEPLVPDPIPFEVEISIAKLKNYKLLGIDQIPIELIQAGGETLQSDIHKLINSIWSKKELPDQWKKPIIVPICKKGDKTGCNNYREYQSYQLHTKMHSIAWSVEGVYYCTYLQEGR
jgi:hypothetical protein